MTQSSEVPEIEDLPVGSVAAEIIHTIASTRYNSELKKIGRAALLGKLRSAAITENEYDIVRSELDAKRKQFRPSGNSEPLSDAPESFAEDRSPTSGLPDEPFERPRDYRESAYKD